MCTPSLIEHAMMLLTAVYCCAQVDDIVAADALRELEKEWLQVEGKAQQQVENQMHAPAQGPQVWNDFLAYQKQVIVLDMR